MSDPAFKGPSIVQGQNVSNQRRHKQILRGDSLFLDWRHGPTTEQMLDALRLLLDNIAENGRLDMVTSHGLKGRMNAKRTGDSPTVPRGSRLEYTTIDGVEDKAWVSHLWTNVKSERNGYIWKAARVIKALVQLIDSGSGPQMRRYTGYSLESDDLKSHEALQNLMDIALSIQVHPTALGVCSAATDKFVVPSGYELEMSDCENVYAFNDADRNRGALLRKDKADSSRIWPITPLV